MADENLNIPSDQNIEFHLVTIFEKLELLRNENCVFNNKVPLRVEVRTLEFWRSVIAECFASFVYIFVVCGAAASGGHGATISSILLPTALAAGFAMTSLTQCFGHISGAHVNPAVSLAMGVTKRISILRTLMFIFAQCGGGVAGAAGAFLYGVTVPGYQDNLSAAAGHTASVAPWERFAVEFLLTFIVVFSYFVSMDTYRKWTGTSALTIGATYSACSFVSMPYLNPARSLGPSFLTKWENHWVYWLGPMLGGLAAGLIYEYIFNQKRQKRTKDSTDGDSSSIHSDEDTYDDLDKPTPPKFHGSMYNTYRSGLGTGGSTYCPSLTNANLYSAANKLDPVEPLYGGTKSLYCKSPPLTRANLNRSQSVYTKSNSAVNKDIIPKPGPLVPAQSLYPMRLNQQTHVQNQNVQNQMQQRSESIYGVRGITPGTANRTDNYATTERTIYGTRNNQTNPENSKFEENVKSGRRPESMYGILSSQARRVPSSQSDESTYGSYGTSSSRNNGASGNGTYHNNQNTGNNFPQKSGNGYPSGRSNGGSEVRHNSGGENRHNGGGEIRQSPASQLLPAASSSSSYHHQHSPNSQY